MLAAIMVNHFQALLLFALVVSAAFAFLTKRSPRARLRYLLWAFFAFIAVAIVAGWLMYPFSH